MGYNGPPGSKTPPPNWWHMLILLLATIVLAKGLGMAYKRDVLDVYEREANELRRSPVGERKADVSDCACRQGFLSNDSAWNSYPSYGGISDGDFRAGTGSCRSDILSRWLDIRRDRPRSIATANRNAGNAGSREVPEVAPELC